MSAIPIPRTAAVELWRRMLRIRMAEEAIAERYAQQKMRCPTHLCSGQEAVAAAAGMVLDRGDLAVSTHRSHGHYLGKGGNLGRMLAELYGKATGCAAGRGGSMHLADLAVGFVASTAIVGGTIPVGVGLGLALKYRKTGRLSCIFLGDAAVEEGVFYESVNFAVLKKLPVLFLCENNLYSVYSRIDVRQPAGRAIHEMVRGLGCPAGSGDGNHALQVYEMIAAAAAQVRGGAGPYFLEFSTYRWREHCGPNYDNDLEYRPLAEFDHWKERDPVLLLQDDLIAAGLVSAAEVAAVQAQITSEVDAAFAFAEQSPWPDPAEAYTNLYREAVTP